MLFGVVVDDDDVAVLLDSMEISSLFPTSTLAWLFSSLSILLACWVQLRFLRVLAAAGSDFGSVTGSGIL